MKTEEGLGYGNLGKGCGTKLGKKTAEHETGEREN